MTENTVIVIQGEKGQKLLLAFFAALGATYFAEIE